MGALVRKWGSMAALGSFDMCVAELRQRNSVAGVTLMLETESGDLMRLLFSVRVT